MLLGSRLLSSVKAHIAFVAEIRPSSTLLGNIFSFAVFLMGDHCRILLNSKTEQGWLLILEIQTASYWQINSKERKCSSSCVLLQVCKGLTPYSVVTK